MSEMTKPAPRQCKLCTRTETDVNPNTWPHSKGVPLGAVCKPCARERKRDFDAEYKKQRQTARAAGTASLVPNVTIPAPTSAKAEPGTAVSANRDRLPGEAKIKQLPVAKALKDGADTINAQAGQVLMTLFGYVNDPTSIHHEWALKMVAERVLPKALYDELGRKEAGGNGAGGGPRITINVMGATPPVHGGVAVIDVTPIEDEGAEDGSD